MGSESAADSRPEVRDEIRAESRAALASYDQRSDDRGSEQRGDVDSQARNRSDFEGSDDLVIRTARDPRLGQMGQNASMEDLMRVSDQQFKPLKQGDVIEGSIMKVDRDEIMIDIGGKTEGIIPAREATSLTQEERDALQIGDELLVSVVQPEGSEGQVVLSLDRARQEKAWRDLQRIFEAGETIQAVVVGHNKGGILVNIEGIRGFIPSSQVSSLPPGEYDIILYDHAQERSRLPKAPAFPNRGCRRWRNRRSRRRRR